MPAEIKARLELVTGDGGVPAAGPSGTDNSMKEMADDFKDIARIMKKPGGTTGLGGLFGDIGATSVLGTFIAGLVAVGIGGALKQGEVIEKGSYDKEDLGSTGKLIYDLYYLVKGWFEKNPTINPVGTESKFSYVNQSPDFMIGEMNSVSEELERIREDGVTADEKKVESLLEQKEYLLGQLSSSGMITEETKKTLDANLKLVDTELIKLGYSTSYTTEIQNQNGALQTQLDLMTKINNLKKSSDSGSYTKDVGGQTYTFSGKTYQLSGGRQVNIGIRTVV